MCTSSVIIGAMCNREHIDPTHIIDNVEETKKYHKLQAAEFPSAYCQNNERLQNYGLCECGTNVNFSCGKGTTLWPPGGEIVTCICDQGVPPGWSERPRCCK